LVVRALADRKLAQLDAYAGYLEELGERDRASFLEDFVACGAARYYLQAAIECSVDIGAHIVATDTSRRAEDYRSIFRVFGEESLIPTDVAAAMEPAAAPATGSCTRTTRSTMRVSTKCWAPRRPSCAPSREPSPATSSGPRPLARPSAERLRARVITPRTHIKVAVTAERTTRVDLRLQLYGFLGPNGNATP
jgi:hypothetical protein